MNDEKLTPAEAARFARYDAIFAAFHAGADWSWGRLDAEAGVRYVAAECDFWSFACARKVAGPPEAQSVPWAWARADPSEMVRELIVHADFQAGLDLAWARSDPALGVSFAARSAAAVPGYSARRLNPEPPPR